jgi:hypothetical protein
MKYEGLGYIEIYTNRKKAERWWSDVRKVEVRFVEAQPARKEVRK